MEPMTKARVFYDGMGWVFECKEHDEDLYADDWQMAYEGALGHLALHHPRIVLPLKFSEAYTMCVILSEAQETSCVASHIRTARRLSSALGKAISQHT